MKFRRIVFDHVPKSGGSFVRSYIANRTPDMLDLRITNDGICSEWSAPEYVNWKNCSYQEVTDPAFMSGHICFSPERFTPKSDDFYFTFIRNPIDLFYSDYFYVNRKYKDLPEHWPIDDVNAYNYGRNLYRRKSLEEYVDWFIDEYDKNMDFHINFYRGFISGKHDFIGVQEHMSESMVKLCELIDIEFDASAIEMKINSNPIANDYSYRRDEIAKLLERQVDIYNEVVNSLEYHDNDGKDDSMNVYITTIDLRFLEDDRPKMQLRVAVLDACIDALQNQGFSINGIITPEWSNPKVLESYKDIPIQTLKTRDLSNYNGDGDAALSPWGSIQSCEILHKVKRNEHESDNEHHAIFELMDIETPCIIADGDLILPRLDRIIPFIDEDRSMLLLPPSHLMYLHEKSDKNEILLRENFPKFKPIPRATNILHSTSTHIPRNVINFFQENGYRFGKGG